jgi:uncharacterized delta-60 repeat protein
MWSVGCLLLLSLVLGTVPCVEAGTPILVDTTFGPVLSGHLEGHTAASAQVYGIALKDGGVYNGCGQIGTQSLFGQVTTEGNFDVYNFNAPAGFNVVEVGDSSYCFSLATQPTDQKTVFGGGTFTGSSGTMLIGRLTSAGVLDTASFASPDGYLTIDFPTIDDSPDESNVWKIQLQPADGFVVIVGQAILTSTPSYQVQLALARVDTSGALDSTFGTAGTQTLQLGDTLAPTGLALQSDGSIVVSAAVMMSGLPQIGVARFTTAGVLDITYGSGAGYILYSAIPADATITGMDIQHVGENEDKIIVSAAAANEDQVLVFRFDTAGNLDSTFGTSGVATLQFQSGTEPNLASLAVAQDGTDNILIAGGVTSVDVSFLAKLSSEGVLDTTFGDIGGDGTFFTAFGDAAGIPGVLTVQQVVPNQAIAINDATWDSNSLPVTAGSTTGVTTDLMFQRFLPNNAQSITIVSPANGQPVTTNPQVFVNGHSSQHGARVDVLIDSVLVFQTVTDMRGDWSAGLSAPLASGSHTVTANLIYGTSTIVTTASSTITTS